MEQSSKSIVGKTVLIVEDDDSLRNIVAKVLGGLGAIVKTAENGLVAKTFLDLDLHSYDLVLTDVRMPGLDGIGLLKHIRTVRPELPVVIFTGFSEVLEAKEAFELGAQGFLPKPFRLATLLEAISEVLAPTLETTRPAAKTAEDFCKISVDDFVSATKLPSDIFIRISENHFVKVARQGAEIEMQRLQVYKEKKVDFFYVHREDFSHYAGFSLKIAGAVSRSTLVSSEQKISIYKHTGEVLLHQIFLEGMDEELCQQVSAMVNNTLSMVAESENLMAFLTEMLNRGDRLYAHSLGVSVYAVMIAKKIGWQAPSNYYRLMLAGLFHDIGMKEIDVALAEKSRAKMTPEEIRIYETHPIRGRDLLLECPEFPEDLAQITFQHHENLQRTGYPTAPITARIHPLARVIRVADELTERLFLLNAKSTPEIESCLKKMLQVKGEEFDAEALGAAFEIFGLPHPRTRAAAA